MAYLDKNGLNYYSQKVSEKIQDVKDDLDELKIIHYEEQEIEPTIITGKCIRNVTVYTINNAAYATCEVEAGETYRISGSSYYNNMSAVVIFSNTNIYYTDRRIEGSFIINSYGQSQQNTYLTPYENTITMPENAKLLLVQTGNINSYPISIVKIDVEKVNRLVYANYLQKEEAANTYAVKDDIGKFISYTKTIESEVGDPSITITDAIANSKPSKFIINSEVNLNDVNSLISSVRHANSQTQIQSNDYRLLIELPTATYNINNDYIYGITFDLINQTSIINAILVGLYGYDPNAISFTKDIQNYPNIARASITLPVQIDFNKEVKCNLANYNNCNYTELKENEFCVAPGENNNEVIIYLNTRSSVQLLTDYHFLFSMIPEVYPLNILSITSTNTYISGYTLDDFIKLNKNNQYDYGLWGDVDGTQMIITYESTTPSKIDGKTYVDNRVNNLQTKLSAKANSADLATVATSGSYTDLSNKPTIPTVPTNVSAFNNDASYVDDQYVDDAITAALADIVGIEYHVCTAQEYNAQTYIPTLQGKVGIIYLVPKHVAFIGSAVIGGDSVSENIENNIYYEFIYNGQSFEMIGDTQIKLGGYLKNTDVSTNTEVQSVISEIFGGE